MSHTFAKSVALGVLTAAVITLAVHNPVSAATRLTFGALTPVTPDNAVDRVASAGECSDPDSNARVTDAYHAGWLKAVASQMNHANARILIDLDSVGNLLQANISTSSGNTFLDDQALIAARGSKYAPEVRNCSSFKRSYYLDIMFDSPTAALPQAGGGSGHRFVD
jgi:TonB family protein